MKSPIFSKEKLLYFPKKSGIVPIFRKSPSSYISYFCEYTPWTLGSKVTVYRRKLQCVFFDLHTPLTCYFSIHRAGSQLKSRSESPTYLVKLRK